MYNNLNQAKENSTTLFAQFLLKEINSNLKITQQGILIRSVIFYFEKSKDCDSIRTAIKEKWDLETKNNS